jgi:hypothetical protein
VTIYAKIVVKKPHTGKDSLNRTVREDSQDRMFRTGRPGQESRYRTTRTGHSRDEEEIRTSTFVKKNRKLAYC